MPPIGVLIGGVYFSKFSLILQDAAAGIAPGLPDTITVARQYSCAEALAQQMPEQGIAFPVINNQDGRFSSW